MLFFLITNKKVGIEFLIQTLVNINIVYSQNSNLFKVFRKIVQSSLIYER